MDEIFALILDILETETVDDELLDAIAEFIQSKLQPAIAAVPQVPAGEYESSNVNGFKYDPKSQKLLVQFHGPYPQSEGPIYSYDGVPPYIFEILRRGAVGPRTSGSNKYHRWIMNTTPSYGAVINAIIKAGNFPYKKIA